MKLCFVLSNVSDCGGTERVCLNIASALAKTETVHVLSLEGDGRAYFPYENKVRIFNLQNRIERKLLASHPKLIILKLKYFFSIHTYDIVIDTRLMNCNLTLPAIQRKNIRHLVWSNFSYEYFRRVKHEQIALQKVLEANSDLLVLTKSDQRLFIEKEGVLPSKIHQIYNPLTFEVPEYTPHNSKKIISVGRFAPEKGFDMLIKAWKIVEEQVPEWTLEIWGDTGEDTGNVYNTFNEVKPKRLRLFPATKDIQSKYKEAAFYVMSSRHEGFPLVLLEAISYSLPIISFDCPNGPREIVSDGENGLLVEPENVESLAVSILCLIRDKELRDLMCRNSYGRSMDFKMEKIIPHWKYLLCSIKDI